MKAKYLPAAIIFIAFSAAAAAHNMEVFYSNENGRVRIEAYYDKAGKASAADVRILDSDGNLLHSGKADKEGIFYFKPAVATDHIVEVRHGGHLGAATIPADELPDTIRARPRIDPSISESRNGPKNTEKPGVPSSDGVIIEQIDRLIREINDMRDENRFRCTRGGVSQAQMNRLIREIHEMRSENRFRDIIGGIGYILGLTGVAAYLLGAKRRRATADDASR